MSETEEYYQLMNDSIDFELNYPEGRWNIILL